MTTTIVPVTSAGPRRTRSQPRPPSSPRPPPVPRSPPSSPSTIPPPWWLYEAVPAAPLPVLDLSLSIKTRFLGPRGVAIVNRWLRHQRFIGWSFAVGSLLVPVAMLVRGPGAVPLGLVATILEAQAPIAGILALRYHVVRLLLGTYDCWFFLVLNAITFATLARQFRDTRVVLVLATSFSYLPNVLHDANLRAMRRLLVSSVFALVATLVFLGLLNLRLIPERRDYALLRYQTHVLPADAVVTSGFASLTAMMLRNVLRKRGTRRRQHARSTMECVTYRCSLRMRPLQRVMSKKTPARERDRTVENIPRPTPLHIQSMRCVQILPNVDVRRTIGPFPFRQPRPIGIASWMAFHGLGLAAAALSMVGCVRALHRGTQQPQPQRLTTTSDGANKDWYVQVLALFLTTVYCGTFAVLYQRQLLLSLVTSFDFLYLSVQLTIIHWSVCDFFDWRPTTLMALVSWMWVHWVLCMDAVTPPVRSILRLPLRAPAVVFTAFVVAGLMVMWVLIVELAEDEITDRVLWSGELWGEVISFRVVPVFYNCVATIVPWSGRLLYRLWRYDRDALVLLEGPVVYENYFLMTRERQKSRLWGVQDP